MAVRRHAETRRSRHGSHKSRGLINRRARGRTPLRRRLPRRSGGATPERNRASSIRRSYVSKGWLNFPPRRPTFTAEPDWFNRLNQRLEVRGQPRNVPRPSSQRSCEMNRRLQPLKLIVWPADLTDHELSNEFA